MSETSANNKRIAKNTLMLYVRMLFTMAVSLFTSRVVLQILGVEDFGIYSVVGRVVAMFSFLNNAMTSSSQRYITYELGKGNFTRVHKGQGQAGSGDRYLNHLYTIKKWHVLQERIPIAESITLY